MRDQVILRVVSKITAPFILVFGFYVVAHGELSPGGGFQGGVVLASAFILYGLVFGLSELDAIVPRAVTDALTGAGLLLYLIVGLVGIVGDYRFLDYTPLRFTGPESAESWGMTLAEYGVGVTVTSVMITIYREVSQRGSAES